MFKSTTAAGVLAAGLLVLSSAPAFAQPSSDIPDDYLGELGEIAPASVTGSLPGYATGPVGSVATAVCNAGSVAGLAGVGLPGFVSPVCMVAPAIGRSIDHFMNGNSEGSVESLIGGVPYVGSLLVQVVPSDSAVEAVDNAVDSGSGGTAGQLPFSSISSGAPGN